MYPLLLQFYIYGRCYKYFFLNTFMEITIFEQIIMILIIKLFNLYIISTFIFFPKILFYYQIILYLYTIPKCELLHSIYIYVYI